MSVTGRIHPQFPGLFVVAIDDYLSWPLVRSLVIAVAEQVRHGRKFMFVIADRTIIEDAAITELNHVHKIIKANQSEMVLVQSQPFLDQWRDKYSKIEGLAMFSSEEDALAHLGRHQLMEG